MHILLCNYARSLPVYNKDIIHIVICNKQDIITTTGVGVGYWMLCGYGGFIWYGLDIRIIKT
jgi:hypothetical protein